LLAAIPEARSQARAQDRTAHVNGMDMHYQVLGSGEPLILLHGFGGCGEDWQPIVEVFAKQYQVIIPDLRGHGASTNPTKTFSHRQSALDVFTLLDQLDLQRIKAMGISSGGMTLLHMATSQPGRIDAMVLIGTTTYFPEQARKIMAVSGQIMPPEVRAMYQRCAKRGEAQVHELIDEFTSFKDSYEDMNFTPPLLGTIKARTLIVQGDRDPFFPVNIPTEMYQAIPGSALWIVPRGGHVPIFGPRQQEFETIASEFLQSGGQN
jgi:pimeloyl-ACP methyl ester carboxylesterase